MANKCFEHSEIQRIFDKCLAFALTAGAIAGLMLFFIGCKAPQLHIGSVTTPFCSHVTEPKAYYAGLFLTFGALIGFITWGFISYCFKNRTLPTVQYLSTAASTSEYGVCDDEKAYLISKDLRKAAKV